MNHFGTMFCWMSVNKKLMKGFFGFLIVEVVIPPLNKIVSNTDIFPSTTLDRKLFVEYHKLLFHSYLVKLG